MRNPLWALALGLAFLFFMTLGVLFLTKKRPPARKSLVPAPVEVSPKRNVVPIDLSRIYENDLFRTYQKPLKPIEPEKFNLVPPPLPRAAPPPMPRAPRVDFLEPLKISVKGIIVSNEEVTNRAIVADEKTKKEDIYSVGDILEDAEIIRIEPEKVIFIRSNGQQETIFLNVRAAAEDPLFSRETSWDTVIQKVTDWSYAVDPLLFATKVRSLANFIEMLDITTALEKGVSTGCLIGRMSPGSIGYALGFKYGDLVTQVNGARLFTTAQRVAVYQSLKNASVGQTIRVKLVRKMREYELLFILKSLGQPELVDQAESVYSQSGQLEETPMITQASPMVSVEGPAALRRNGGRAAWLQRT